MVVTVTALSFPMPISKCTFEGFGQNCFKILLFVLKRGKLKLKMQQVLNDQLSCTGSLTFQ